MKLAFAVFLFSLTIEFTLASEEKKIDEIRFKIYTKDTQMKIAEEQAKMSKINDEFDGYDTVKEYEKQIALPESDSESEQENSVVKNIEITFVEGEKQEKTQSQFEFENLSKPEILFTMKIESAEEEIKNNVFSKEEEEEEETLAIDTTDKEEKSSSKNLSKEDKMRQQFEFANLSKPNTMKIEFDDRKTKDFVKKNEDFYKENILREISSETESEEEDEMEQEFEFINLSSPETTKIEYDEEEEINEVQNVTKPQELFTDELYISEPNDNTEQSQGQNRLIEFEENEMYILQDDRHKQMDIHKTKLQSILKKQTAIFLSNLMLFSPIAFNFIDPMMYLFELAFFQSFILLVFFWLEIFYH